jgi:hypothetical protein
MPKLIITLTKYFAKTAFWKTCVLFGLQFLSVNSFSHLHLDGLYKGKNLYIQNPTTDDNIGFCVDSVYVNATKIEFNRSQAAFEIPLDNLGLTIGDSMHIVIYHQPKCKPVVLDKLHYNVSKSGIKNVTIDSTGLIKWETVTSASCIYIVLQHKWHKWIDLDTLKPGKTGVYEPYSYQAQLHSGENKFRLASSCRSNHCFRKLTAPYSIQSNMKKVAYKMDKERHTILFDTPTKYEIFNRYGERIKGGFGESVSLSELSDRHYFINYDNTSAKIKLKKKKND